MWHVFKRRAFEQQVLVHMDSLYRYAYSLTGNREDAEDLVQETMLKAYDAFGRLKKGSNVKAWLFTILRNTFLNSKRGTGKPGFFVHTELSGFAGGEDPSRIVQLRLDADAVREVIEQLPEEFRTPLVLCDVEGFSYKEISEIMNCPVGTVMSRLYRARRQVRKALTQHTNIRLKEQGDEV